MIADFKPEERHGNESKKEFPTDVAIPRMKNEGQKNGHLATDGYGSTQIYTDNKTGPD